MMALRNQGPLAELTMWDQIVPPKGWGAAIDYDQDKWNIPGKGVQPAASPPSPFKNVYVHWGGGPNQAGDYVEEPELTRAEKISVQMGVCGSVIRSWERYHLSKGWRGVAYELLFDPRFGKIFRGRGWAQGAGCYGHWNKEGLSFVFILGSGQFPTLSARKSFGRVMLELGNVKAMPHYATNFDTPPQYQTSCPGRDIGKWVENMGWCDDLPILSSSLSHRPTTRSATKRLADLGYLDGPQRKYGPKVVAVVKKFQGDAGITVDGVCGPETYRALQKAH